MYFGDNSSGQSEKLTSRHEQLIVKMVNSLLLPMHRFGLLPVCETTKGTDPSNINEVCLNLCVLVDDKIIIFLANGVQAS